MALIRGSSRWQMLNTIVQILKNAQNKSRNRGWMLWTKRNARVKRNSQSGRHGLRWGRIL